MVKNILYVLAFVISNLAVLKWGVDGLIFSSLFLIPFDFVMRSVFHETWKGKELVVKLGSLIILSSIATLLINYSTIWIAIASAVGFFVAQLAAGLFYQLSIKKSFFIKVNGSDLIAIIIDAIIFQFIAFGNLNYYVFFTQIILKLFGGFIWYWIIFEKFKLQNKINKL